MVAFGHCFRAEAGSTGLRDRGLYRLHQFSKVEMFSIGTSVRANSRPRIIASDPIVVTGAPEQSEALHDEMLQIEEEIFSELGLHYKYILSALSVPYCLTIFSFIKRGGLRTQSVGHAKRGLGSSSLPQV